VHPLLKGDSKVSVEYFYNIFLSLSNALLGFGKKKKKKERT
jgi:hypothetical protein